MLYLEDKNALELIPALEQPDFSFKPLAEYDDLTPVLKSIREITDFEIEVLLFHLIGGYILRYQGADILVPQCCCDLDNLKDWKSVLQYDDTKWTMHWIGHPWVRVKFEGGYLIFTDYTESDDEEPHFAVKPDILANAVNEAEKIVQDFMERLLKLMA